ncbi:MAG: hypothetical protein JXN64_13305 [Spirochaetes bacterium]|nr:hypothetical protein [Spirochaetota bacterium]
MMQQAIVSKIQDKIIQTDRQKLIQLINDFSASNGLEFGDAMSHLYICLGHRLCTNISAEAAYKKMRVLNYIEEQNLMKDALKTATELFV